MIRTLAAVHSLCFACLVFLSGCAPGTGDVTASRDRMQSLNANSRDIHWEMLGGYRLDRATTAPSGPRAGYGTVFLFRKSNFFGAGSSWIIGVDGGRSIQLSNGKCVTWQQPAGPCKLTVVGWTFTGREERGTGASVTVPVEEGASCYVEMRPGRGDLVQVDSKTGEELVNNKFKAITLP